VEFQVEISGLALREIEEALQWLHERSPASAARSYWGLLEAIQSLGIHSKRCSLAPESDALAIELRQLLYGKRKGIYRILFTVHRGTVYIHRFRHGSQRLLEP
jgi:plasmid stabilization system protein ParE